MKSKLLFVVIALCVAEIAPAQTSIKSYEENCRAAGLPRGSQQFNDCVRVQQNRYQSSALDKNNSVNPRRVSIKRHPSADMYYPQSAKQAGMQGTPVVRACVDSKATIQSSELVTTSGYRELDDAAITLALASEYEAARDAEGRLTSGCISFRVNFAIVTRDSKQLIAERSQPVDLSFPYRSSRSGIFDERNEKEREKNQVSISAVKNNQPRVEDPLRAAKSQCRDLGFKEKTEKFGTCVLELSKRGSDQQARSESRTVRGDGTPDDATCVGYGYAVGSSGYADCRMKLDQARREYQNKLRVYEAEKEAFDRRVAEGEAEAQRRRKERQAQYGFCVAACSSQPGATTLGCFSRCGSASSGFAFDPGEPPARPSGFTTYIINGRVVNCSSLGSMVTCN